MNPCRAPVSIFLNGKKQEKDLSDAALLWLKLQDEILLRYEDEEFQHVTIYEVVHQLLFSTNIADSSLNMGARATFLSWLQLIEAWSGASITDLPSVQLVGYFDFTAFTSFHRGLESKVSDVCVGVPLPPPPSDCTSVASSLSSVEGAEWPDYWREDYRTSSSHLDSSLSAVAMASLLPPTVLVRSQGGSLFGDFPGEHALPRDGMHCLVRALCAEERLQELVQTESAVLRVVLPAAGPVRVECSQRALQARCVCVTAPLAPLRRIAFSPPLPAHQRAAMDRIQGSTYKKVQLEWTEPFWPADDPFMVLVDQTATDPLAAFLAHRRSSIAPAAVDLGPSLLLDNFLNLRGIPVLEAICPGEQGRRLFGLPDRQVQAAVMSLLRRHFPQAPDPCGLLVTRWEEDPWSGCAYSFHSAATRHDDAAAAAASVGDRLFFAGEHTDPLMYGSLNAAYSSGLRAAGEILSKALPWRSEE